MREKQCVASFDLSEGNQKHAYESILNTYAVIRTEFAYMKDGTPKVTIWYLKPDDD